MDRTSFTGFMVAIDDMTDTQLSVLYAYVRDTKANRATEKAMRRRATMNAPTPAPTAETKAADRK
jgi:hypothetical protein